jgi:hypothetical protein
MSQKRKQFLALFTGALLVFSILGYIWISSNTKSVFTAADDTGSTDFFVGVEMAYDGVEDAKKLIDKIKDYTNVFVIGTPDITHNITKLNEVSQYAIDAGLDLILFTYPTEEAAFNQSQWITNARTKWGDRFLGVYAYDEWGGNQLDATYGDEDYWKRLVTEEEASNYTEAANLYVNKISEGVLPYYTSHMKQGDLKLFTADYALYWFTYEGGYDVILAEFGWNHSRPLNVALVRGAATMQNKEWGTIITWKGSTEPLMESGDELYYDMVLAYLSGAKYIVVFNYPNLVSPYGLLTDEHFDAMQRFWDYVNSCPRNQIYGSSSKRIAYVLPKDYGWGFRGAEDKVWGLWTDSLSTQIGTDLNYLLDTQHIGLDIIYDDPKYYNALDNYSKLIFWNGTIIE